MNELDRAANHSRKAIEHLLRPEDRPGVGVFGMRGPAAELPTDLVEMLPSGLTFAPPVFRFEFQKHYSRLYTNRHDKFVLREEHVLELKRIVKEHQRDRLGRGEPLSVSDIINVALDFAFEHPSAFHPRVNPDCLRETLGAAVVRKVILQFVRKPQRQIDESPVTA